MSRSRVRLGFAFAVLLLMTAFYAAAGSQSLSRGQIVKQFFAYSITQSLKVRPLTILDTGLPCEPPRKWVEEPPVYHWLAAQVERVVPSPAVMPLLVWGALAWGLALLAFSVLPGWAGVAVSLSAALSPAFVRYSVQQLPDLFAATGVVYGAYFLWRRRLGPALFFLTFAVTAKALVLFAAMGLLFWYHVLDQKRPLRQWVYSLAWQGALLVAPFVLWLAVIHVLEIPSPFHLNRGLDNRHSGSFELLLSPSYYRRVFTWVAIKGAGLVFFAGLLASALPLTAFRRGFSGEEARLRRMLLIWAMSLIPYFAFVRQGNAVHDYYVLGFIAPVALLGAQFWISLRWRAVALAFLGLNAALGLNELRALRAVELAPGQERPSFCHMEK